MRARCWIGLLCAAACLDSAAHSDGAPADTDLAALDAAQLDLAPPDLRPPTLLTVSYENHSTGSTSNSTVFYTEVHNAGSQTVALRSVTLRYWFTAETS